MDLSTGVNLGQMLMAFCTMLVVSGVAWGGLLQRVKTLEKEVAAMGGFASDITEIKTNLTHTSKQVDKLVNKLLDGSLAAPTPAPRRRT